MFPQTFIDKTLELIIDRGPMPFHAPGGRQQEAHPLTNSHRDVLRMLQKQGALTLLVDTLQGGTTLDLSTLAEGDWVVLSKPAANGGYGPDLSDGAVGTYRVERVGRGLDGAWEEESMLVAGSAQPVIAELARRFHQNAVYRWTPQEWSIIGVHMTGSRHLRWRGSRLS